MSYALDSKARQASQRSADFNHFVVFDPYNTIACHDFEVCPLVCQKICNQQLVLQSTRQQCSSQWQTNLKPQH